MTRPPLSAVASGAGGRPPKTPRPWPVVRVDWDDAAEDAGSLVARWSAGGALPWIDELSERVRDMTAGEVGAPPSWGSSTSQPRPLLYTFVWEDSESERVLFWANRLADETGLDATLAERIPETDLWIARFVMPSDWNASYCFLTQRPGQEAPWARRDQTSLRHVLDQGLSDPRCPDSQRNRAGVVQSVVVGPDAPKAAIPEGGGGVVVPAGALTRAVVGERQVVLHDPAGVPLDVPLDVLIVLDGEVWLQRGLPGELDTLAADGALPARRTVFLDSGGRERRWRDLGGAGAEDVDPVTEIVDLILPWLRAQRGCASEASRVAIAGQSLGGLTALRAVLRRSDKVGVALSASASLWQDDLVDAVVECARRGGAPRVHLTHGAQEWVLARPHQRLAEVLAASGCEVRSASHQGGHDYAWWRTALHNGLVWWTEGSEASQGS